MNYSLDETPPEGWAGVARLIILFLLFSLQDGASTETGRVTCLDIGRDLRYAQDDSEGVCHPERSEGSLADLCGITWVKNLKSIVYYST